MPGGGHFCEGVARGLEGAEEAGTAVTLQPAAESLVGQVARSRPNFPSPRFIEGHMPLPLNAINLHRHLHPASKVKIPYQTEDSL